MTAIRSPTQPMSRRTGVLGVHSIDHFHLAVRDVGQAARFYGAFGLEPKEQGNALNLYTAGNPHRWGAVTEGPRKRLGHISFGAFEEDFARFKERLQTLGIARLDYVRDPWGSWCEYAADIDYIPAGTDWQSGDHPPEDSFYVWGPEPPADFAVNREA